MNRAEAVELARGLPAWVLRAVIAMSVAGIVLMLAAAGIEGVVLILICLTGAGCVAMPSSPAPTLMLLLMGLSVLALGAGGIGGPMLALVPLTHLMHVGCALAGLLPARSRVHLSALRAPALRFVAIQAGVFALAGLMAVVSGIRPPAVLEFGAVAGVTAIALLVAWLLHRPQ
ncbi:MAG TPA: hypothetical protein VFT95_03930 [Micromonosporaceae bacterium]|nr:hypothetical protein [Micromonosporaceae bacterium]